jgi:hypothetical protein
MRGREKPDVTWVRVRYNQMTTETSLKGDVADDDVYMLYVKRIIFKNP